VDKYLERFILPVLSSVAAAIIVGKLQLSFKLGAITFICITVSAYLAVTLRDRIAAVNKGLVRSNWITTCIISLLMMCVCVVGYVVFHVLASQNQPIAKDIKANSESPVKGTKTAESKQDGTLKATQAPGGTTHPPIRSNFLPSHSAEDVFLEKYVVQQKTELGRSTPWAVLIGGHDETDFPELNSSASDVLHQKGYRTASIFRPTLIRDHGLDDVYSGDGMLSRKLAPYCAGIVVGKVSSETVKNADLEGIFTTRLSLNVRIISTASASVEGQFRVEENGAGYTQKEAESNAEERLAKKLKDRLLSAVP
jgi:hypothetical protein